MDYFIKIIRVDSTMNIGVRELLFYQRHNYNSGANRLDLSPAFIGDMESTLNSNIINRGTDNVFGNVPNQNINNIERLDVVFPNGLSTSSTFDVGFMVLERGGNDPFAIAPITSINADSTPASYGSLLHVGTGTWGLSNINVRWVIMRQEDGDTIYRIVEDIANQRISGVFMNFDELGVNPTDTIYGYSLFGHDVDTNSHILTSPWTFPRNTSNATGAAGGLDIISIPGVFATSNSLLPLHWDYFNANRENGVVKLEWAVHDNTYGDVFIIEKSTDKIEMKQVGTLYASGEQTFQFFDDKFYHGKQFYRIKRISSNGEISYTQFETIHAIRQYKIEIEVLENPFRDNVALDVYGAPGETITLSVFNNSGQLVLTEVVKSNSESRNHVVLNMEQQKAGSYYIRAESSAGRKGSAKLIKIH